ncbi:hypothetical protein D5086_018115 [Populus alba]|uniref:Uncharacterized protein n=1 Tax=Populus alba TaxID=43335 RepID=A0ACC4BNT0_POPAL
MLRKGLIRGAVNVPLSTVTKGSMECGGRKGEKIGVWFWVACGEKWRGFCINGSGEEVGGILGLEFWAGMGPGVFLEGQF